MENLSYLQNLNARLAEGIDSLPEGFRARHASFIGNLQNVDGGFSGREGGSDLYYTSFALRSLSVLDALMPEACDRATVYLRQCLTQGASVVDFFSLLYACMLIQASGGPDVLEGAPRDWPDRVAATLESFRTPDNGYAKAAGATGGSTYHTFLVGLSYQLLGRSWPRPAEVVSFVRSRRREDGGFVEIAPMRRSGTNPTAAAVGALQIAGDEFELTETEKEETATFLAEMPSLEGGMRANSRAPLADLLSTFTGAWTLSQIGHPSRIDTGAALAFAQSLEQPGGGFRGGLWDDRSDVEYTFYGLGVVALLSDEAPSSQE